jgi:hypothetical protein
MKAVRTDEYCTAEESNTWEETMFHKRWIVIAVAALIVFGIFSAVSGAGQREAWMEGYMAGRLSAGSDGSAALTPYLMPGSPFGPHYGGSGPGLFFGLAFLAFGLFLVGRRLSGARWNEQPGDWHQHMREEARRWHQRHEGPWNAQPGESGPGDEQRMI